MTGNHCVDPELLPALDLFPPLDLSVENLPALRVAMTKLMSGPPASDNLPVSVVERQVAGPEGSPPVRVLEYRPVQATGPLPAILHIHPGGYVVGTPDMMEAGHRQLAADLGCAIYSVDYRLAPETRYPGAIEDCYTVLAWMFTEAAALGLEPSRIGVKGESAGGGLAAALALLTRDRGEHVLAFQHLHYPMLDDRTGLTATSHPRASSLVWSAEQNAFGWTALLGAARGGPDVPPYAAAARADDLRGLPPRLFPWRNSISWRRRGSTIPGAFCKRGSRWSFTFSPALFTASISRPRRVWRSRQGRPAARPCAGPCGAKGPSAGGRRDGLISRFTQGPKWTFVPFCRSATMA